MTMVTKTLYYACFLFLFGTQFFQASLGFVSPHKVSPKVGYSQNIQPLFQSAPSTSETSSEAPLQSQIEDVEETSKGLLADAINFNATCASEILSKVNNMRENGAPAEQYLDDLLSSVPDASSLPFWTRSKLLARFSRRARMASLSRTLDIATPLFPENENESESAGEQRRRRRALATLLRSLAADKGKRPLIVNVEKKAMRAFKEDSTNLRNRLPEGLETPEYEVLARRASSRMEIRRYQPFSTCAVSMDQTRPINANATELGGASSFGALSGYLFGENDQSTAMNMTTPVLTSPIGGGEDSGRQMEVVLPSEYWNSSSLSKAPQPLKGSGMTLQQRESEERAVLMFGGYAPKKEIDRRKKELLASLSSDMEWKQAEEFPTVAQYNDPFTAPWRRLNEVSIKVVKK